ncbi:MAG: NnrS family protein [Propionivibrio sp.]|uniref:NnrS family protein n=1 Tax=Propionivibrio sp. TaxID=2212460 RepID=UPI001B46E09C|nr:NnrS family protein [Propionivibrio sp.]MBP7202671.1 NnrS family protein [Propionivibrio sp.]MBP8215626.1 NnrS family protein [Propionivibrio sp.]
MIAKHPLWLVGFRPFFILACLSGLALPMIWALMFSGTLPMPATTFSANQWHAHEMFFGFGWAVLGGFLLTATKNWVKIRGYHGLALIYLVAVWLVERAAVWFQGALPPAVFFVANNLFLTSIVVMLLFSLLRHREKDAYPDNYFFLVMLPAFLIAKNVLLSADHFQSGIDMTIGLFRIAFLVMFERTLTQFMRNVFSVDILRNPLLDTTIKSLAVLLIPASFMTSPIAGWIGLLLAVLMLVRFVFWKPQLAMRRIDLGIMYLGYLAIATQLVLKFLDQTIEPAWVGTLSIHVFTLGAMGLVIPAMIVRIAKGHTGRKVGFDSIDKWVLRIMILGLIVRTVAPQLHPAWYLHWLHLAATCWFVAFAILAWRYVPFLTQARIDGKEH